MLAVASDAGTRPENRATALARAAERGVSAALPAARRWAERGETPLLRNAAAAAAAKLEGLN